MTWNLATALESVADAIPDAPAQRQGERTDTWATFDAHADALAADLLDAGLGHQAKVAAYLQNCPEYLETYFAAFKAGLAPVNVNFRYGPAEVRYLLDNADAEAVVFHARYAEVVAEVRDDLPGVRRWYCVDDGEGERPDWAVPYAEVVARSADRVTADWGRSTDDLLLLYTGGTTGMPKGVMWRAEDLFRVLGSGGNAILGIPPVDHPSEIGPRLAGPGGRQLVCCPLMHGTGQFSAFITMFMGGSVTTLPPGHFDPAATWDLVERHGINQVVIVGDAFARPLLQALEAEPDRWDLSSMLLMSSSGVMWSQPVKEGLIRHIPQLTIFDSLGSSEAVGLGGSVSNAELAEQTAKFALGENCQVFTDDDRAVAPGSDEIGMVAVSGNIPLGYYKDPEKTARTFRTIDGKRWSIPGDFARVEADGSLTLLGRGSVCINTGGEKVFPEEVEEALKTHAGVRDAVAVGVPDERFGQIVCAVVESEGEAPADDELIEHVRAQLAHYKAPRKVLAVDTIGRAPNGKVDYKRLTALAAERFAAT